MDSRGKLLAPALVLTALSFAACCGCQTPLMLDQSVELPPSDNTAMEEFVDLLSPSYEIESPDVVQVELTRDSAQPVTERCLVQHHGTITLGDHGEIAIAGKTVAEARQVIEEHLAKSPHPAKVSLKMLACNSKVYYIITEGEHLGDNVVRLPFTGKETVLDRLFIAEPCSEWERARGRIDAWITRLFGVAMISPGDTIRNFQTLERAAGE